MSVTAMSLNFATKRVQGLTYPHFLIHRNWIKQLWDRAGQLAQTPAKSLIHIETASVPRKEAD